MGCRTLIGLIGLALLSCTSPGASTRTPAAPGATSEPRFHRASATSTVERYCAWYADARGGVLYFGAAAFWSSLRAHGGDPGADLLHRGPQLVGRFDLERERFLAPLATGASAPRSGTWDVLAHANGRVYFTAFFEPAGYVEPATGETQRFHEAGAGLNELVALPDGRLLATRYAAPGLEDGSVVLLDADGGVLAEHRLAGPEGWQVAPKSVAFDPRRGEIWVTTDLLPRDGGSPRHDARILDAESGRERRRIEQPEIQFVLFAPDGAGYLAERQGTRLSLHMLGAGAAAAAGEGRRVVLDADFPAHADFVQDLKLAEDGSIVVTRWSGRLHLVDRSGSVRSLQLPRPGSAGLYYTAVLADGRLCATYCDDVTVVCTEPP